MYTSGHYAGKYDEWNWLNIYAYDQQTDSITISFYRYSSLGFKRKLVHLDPNAPPIEYLIDEAHLIRKQ